MTLLKEKSYSNRNIVKLKKYDTGICVNGVHIRTIDRVSNGDVLSVSIEETGIPATSYDNIIEPLYEDDDVAVFFKPPFMAVHPAKLHQDNTLANSVAAYFESKGFYLAFRCVNRLDRDTSGLVVCAKHALCASKLWKSVNKEYFAIVCGELKVGERATIDEPIDRDPDSKMLRAVVQSGKRAVTNYEVISAGGGYSLLKINLETGRTHQIRVHLKYIGYPLVGDGLYYQDSELISRHALNCSKVWFNQPITGELVVVETPLPSDMLYIIENIIA